MTAGPLSSRLIRDQPIAMCYMTTSWITPKCHFLALFTDDEENVVLCETFCSLLAFCQSLQHFSSWVGDVRLVLLQELPELPNDLPVGAQHVVGVDKEVARDEKYVHATMHCRLVSARYHAASPIDKVHGH